MYTLFHCVASRSFRALWALEEMGFDYELKVLPFPPRALAKEFLAINPLGTVPLLLGPTIKMTESSAICQYLATLPGCNSRFGVDPAEEDYGAYLNFLYFGEATLTFPIALYMRYSKLEPAERLAPQVSEDYRKFFFGRLRLLSERLKTREFVCAGRFTAADVSVTYALLFAEFNGLASGFSEDVARYLAQMKTMPSFKSALERERVALEAAPLPESPA